MLYHVTRGQTRRFKLFSRFPWCGNASLHLPPSHNFADCQQVLDSTVKQEQENRVTLKGQNEV